MNALACLWARERSGRGAHGEVAQVEAVTGFLGDWLWKAGVAPGSVGPTGNRSERGAPWGLYPCAGDQQWCAITVRDDDDWRRLGEALGRPEWAIDPALARAPARHAAHERIDAALGAWTRERPRDALAATLQAHGVPAGPMLTGADQIEDPHFRARGYPRWLEQTDVGPLCFEGPAFRASGMSDVTLFPAPRLGEHTREVARELGLDDAEIDALVERGALELARSTEA